MKVKSIFQNALSNNQSSERSGRSHNDFQLLSSSDNPEFYTSSREREASSSSRMQTLMSENLPIELTDLPTASTRNNNLPISQNPSSNCESPCESNNGFMESRSLQFDDDFRVYNSTSEEVPHDESEDILPRLNIRELISEGSNINEHFFSNTYSPRKGKCDVISCCCWCSYCNFSACRWKNYIKSIIIFSLLITMCVTSIVILVLSLQKTTKETEDYEKLLNAEDWPLDDIESNSKEQRQNWVLRFADENESKQDTSEKSQGVIKAKNNYPGILSINGHFIDETIAQKVFHSARGLLKSNLNKNSSKLDIMSWKGEAVNFVIQELELRLNTAGKENHLQGVLEDEFCYNDNYLVCNKTVWFRTTNGSCNNVIHKSWGSLYSHFHKLSIPMRMTTEPLPLAQSAIEKLTNGTPHEDPAASAILPLWGMFILHDTVKTAKSPVPCHDSTDNNSSQVQSQNATNAKRECPGIYPACKIGPRTSFNLVTSFVDASNIYGSSEERTNKLRLKRLGKMKVKVVKHTHAKGFLPLANEQNETCFDRDNKNCFISGDDDVHHLSALTALNTLFIRQHNWIASWLKGMNGHWNDDRLFQESRRIVIAQIQHITYNEFLPQILGNQMTNLSGLLSQHTGFYEGYDSEVNPSVSDAFAGAVGLFWSSMAVERVQSIWKTGKVVVKSMYNISAQVLRPEFLVKDNGHLEAIIRGFISLPVNLVGLEFAALFRSLHIKSLNTTVNLIGTVLERARRLQIAPYIEWRRVCGFNTVKVFQDVKSHWYPEAYSSITSVYRSLEQVDLFIGMLAEKPIPSGRVGPTLACLLMDQFSRFKRGDRFWYEGNVYFHHFTELQLKSIRETSLARILCDNTDKDFDEIQKQAMILTSPQTNPLLSCTDIRQLPRINFHLWKENPEHTRTDYGMSKESDSCDDDDLNMDSIIDEENSNETSNELESIITTTDKSTTEFTTTSKPAIVSDGESVSSITFNNASSSNSVGSQTITDNITNFNATTTAKEKLTNYITSKTLPQINSTRGIVYEHPILKRIQQVNDPSFTN